MKKFSKYIVLFVFLLSSVFAVRQGCNHFHSYYMSFSQESHPPECITVGATACLPGKERESVVKNEGRMKIAGQAEEDQAFGKKDTNDCAGLLDVTSWEQNALKLLSFPSSFNPRVVDVSKCQSARLNIPFLCEAIADKPIITVELRVDCFQFASGNISFTNRQLDRIIGIFFSDTGQFVEALIEREGVGMLPGEMSAKDAEARYKVTREMYHGFPQKNSTVSVYKILDSLAAINADVVWQSQKIIIRYLVNSREGILQNEPRWIVNCYGFPPIPARGISRSTNDERSRLRYIFSKEGVFIRGDNQP